MRPLVILQSSLFAALVLGVAAAAGSRAVPFERPADVDWVDGRLAKAFESHYDETFPAKTLGVNLWAAIDYLLFDEGRPGIVLGQQGWLYTDEEFKDYAGAEATVATHLALIPWVRDELARQGTQLVVAVVPSKARIYPEYLGERRPAALHGSLYERALKSLRDAGVAAPDLARTLTACKRQSATFLRTDTHWTPAGARCAAQAVLARAPGGTARRGGATKFRTQVTAGEAPYRGDLFKFLPLDPYFSALLPAGEPVEVHHTELASATDADGLLGDPAAPPIVLVGTSYSADERWNLAGALQEAFQDDVGNYAARGKGPFMPMLDYLLNNRDPAAAPRLVVWEIPERYLPVAQDLRVERAVPPGCNASGAPAARPKETL
jgi:alginate O-acetyltransferase complex protein AlgJ